jgi:hypothetical protein
VGGALSRSSGYTTAFTVQANPQYAALASAGVLPEVLGVSQAVDVIASELSLKSFERDLGAGDSKFSIETKRIEDSNAIAVNVSASTQTAVGDAVEEIATRSMSIYQGEINASLSELTRLDDQRKTLAEGRLAVVDDLLSKARTDQQTLVEGLIVERGRLIDSIDSIDARSGLIERYGESSGSQVRTLGLVPVTRGIGTIQGILFGLIGGSAVVIGATLALTAIDRRIRSRRDLQRLGLPDLVAVIPRSISESSLRSARAALDTLGGKSTSHTVQLVPVESGGSLVWADDLTKIASSKVHVELCGSVDVDPNATGHAADCGTTILAVKWGRDRRNEVVRAANEFAAAGSPAIAVILYDVPDAEVSTVEA